MLKLKEGRVYISRALESNEISELNKTIKKNKLGYLKASSPKEYDDDFKDTGRHYIHMLIDGYFEICDLIKIVNLTNEYLRSIGVKTYE